MEPTLEEQMKVYNASSKGYIQSLQLDLAGIVDRALKAKRWYAHSDRELARRLGGSRRRWRRIRSGDANLDFRALGKMMHALGIKVQLVDGLIPQRALADVTLVGKLPQLLTAIECKRFTGPGLDRLIEMIREA